MIRLLKLLSISLLIFTFLEAEKIKELFKEIKKSESKLIEANNETNSMSKEFNKIINEIKKLNNEILEYDKKLDKIDSFLVKEDKKYKMAMAEISTIEENLNKLNEEIRDKSVEFAKKISKTLGTVIAKNDQLKDEKSILSKEILEKYKAHNQEEILKLSRSLEQKKRLKEQLIERKKAIELSIKDIKEKRKIFEEKQKKRKVLLSRLERKEREYSKKLKKLLKVQTAIRDTLSKLNILKTEAVKEAKRKERELNLQIKRLKQIRERLEKQRKRSIRKGKKFSYRQATIKNVKKFSNSYIKVPTVKYRGIRTISPVVKPVVKKPFGRFYDPIYKIKSFNESIILKPSTNDKRVFNVLDGKVVFIGESAAYGKSVVIKHSNGIHTIYGGLTKISEFIKKGRYIRKGRVIGRVNSSLIFQVRDKKGRLINPRKMIKL